MSTINSVTSSVPVQQVAAPTVQRETAAEPSAARSSSDRVELSGMSHLLAALKSNDIRTEKVAAIKAQIEAGTYEDDYKLDVASDRMLDDLMR
jgi:flagellar biosynthesis anti-sigma factor FlgM